jgi:hypothetical protein
MHFFGMESSSYALQPVKREEDWWEKSLIPEVFEFSTLPRVIIAVRWLQIRYRDLEYQTPKFGSRNCWEVCSGYRLW